MRPNYYPPGTVETLIKTDLVKQQTAKVLGDRLEKEEIIVPVFFDEKTFQILQSVCKRLIPQPGRIHIIDLAGLLDEQLATGTGKGWRYDEMPAGKIIYSKGLLGINETAKMMYGKTFTFLKETEQDKVLTEIQSGIAKGKTWEEIPSARFFEELLALLTELYYSHPIAKDEIGEVAFADGKGWHRLGLNEHEVHEPLPLANADNGE